MSAGFRSLNDLLWLPDAKPAPVAAGFRSLNDLLWLPDAEPIVAPVPPVPAKPALPQAVGGIALPTRQPFWAAPAVRAAGLVVGPAGSIRGKVRSEEDELASEECQLLELL